MKKLFLTLFAIFALTAEVTAGAQISNPYQKDTVRMLAQSAAAASITGTVTETTLASIAVPGGTMGANGSLRVTARWSYTNSANNKTLSLKFGGSTYIAQVRTTSLVDYWIIPIMNRGVTNSQIGSLVNAIGSGTVAFPTSAVDTSADQTMLLTATLANTGETITLESYSVEILKP